MRGSKNLPSKLRLLLRPLSIWKRINYLAARLAIWKGISYLAPIGWRAAVKFLIEQRHVQDPGAVFRIYPRSSMHPLFVPAVGVGAGGVEVAQRHRQQPVSPKCSQPSILRPAQELSKSILKR